MRDISKSKTKVDVEATQLTTAALSYLFRIVFLEVNSPRQQKLETRSDSSAFGITYSLTQ